MALLPSRAPRSAAPHSKAESVSTADGHSLALHRSEPSVASRAAAAPTQPLRGLAVLLLHGFAQNRRTWLEGALPRLLADRGAQVWLGELRGHGASDPPRPGARGGLDAHLELDLPALFAAVRATGPSALALVGHSMGGLLGYASLARDFAPELLVTLASPVRLGAERPLVRALAAVAAPTLAPLGPARLPLDVALARTAALTTLRPRGGPFAGLREVFRLGNPREADVDALRLVLSTGDAVDARVLRDLAVLTRGDPAVIGGVSIERALAESGTPVLAVAGGRDSFAGPSGFAPEFSPSASSPGSGARAPRRLLWLEHAGHVDLTMGHASLRIVDAIVELARDAALSA
jgi:pimeloyl-ACP methyl ester carboxylesterase